MLVLIHALKTALNQNAARDPIGHYRLSRQNGNA